MALGPRYLGSAGHAKAEQFILSHLDGAQIEQDKFTAETAAGRFAMNNIIAKFPGKKDGIIVLAGHYDTNYPLRNTSYVGANDGGSNVGLMLEIASQLRTSSARGLQHLAAVYRRRRSHRGVDRRRQRLRQQATGEEVVRGRHGREDQGVSAARHDRRQRSGHRPRYAIPRRGCWMWCTGPLSGSGSNRTSSRAPTAIEDDHLPFRAVGIPVADIIDLDYGFDNIYHHTTQDTPDKCSAASLQIVGDVMMETIRALNTR